MTRGATRERMGEIAVLARALLNDRRLQGLAFAKQWRERQQRNSCTPTADHMPFPNHRTCADWNDALAKEGR